MTKPTLVPVQDAQASVIQHSFNKIQYKYNFKMEESNVFSLTATKEPTIPVTSQEEKELRRVYDQLCDYHRKKMLKKELTDFCQWQE
jgi:hypothetical protein